MLVCVISAVVGLLTLAGPATAILCDNDVELESVQEHSYDIGHDAADMSYWRTYHNNFIVFGKFIGDPTVGSTTIEAGYYTADGGLVYKAVINCADETWEVIVTSEDTGEEETFLDGILDTACAKGDIFDIFLKVQQPRLMNWVFDGQALQTDTQITKFRNKERSRALYVPTLHQADTASTFKITTTGSAVLTRFAFGKCVVWPEELTSNCTEVKTWLLSRSKSAVSGLGDFGTNNNDITMECVATRPQYYAWLQSSLHPDKDSKNGSNYCCCVDMETGELYQDDKKWCIEDYLNACTQLCMETYNSDLMYD